MKTRQVILITGSTRGLGKHLRQHLTAQGHDVYGSARAEVPGDDHHLSLDVTDAAAAAKAVQTVIARAGRLDVLINNAGSHLLGAALETSDVELREQLELNFFGAVNLMQAAVPHFLERRAGRIINVSSVGGRLATPFASAYAASKFALEGYTEALRLELLPFGVFVTNLEPGFLATGSTDQSVIPVKGSHPLFVHARAATFERMQQDGPRGAPLSLVARQIDRVLSASRPKLRSSVDGFLTRLELLRAVSPGATFEQAVLKQTAPELLGGSTAAAAPRLA